MTTIYLIRHGEIDANREQRWHGWTDSELNERGRAQAAKMAEQLACRTPAISSLYSSPLKRTLTTAQCLGELIGLEPVAHEGLKEFGIGQLENQPYLALKDEHRFFDRITEDLDYAPPEGESVNAVCNRFLGALEEIRGRHRGETLGVVSHGAAMAIALAKLLDGAPMPFYQYHMENTAITKLVWQDEPIIEFFNWQDHLVEL